MGRIRVERAVADGSTLDAPVYADGWVVLSPGGFVLDHVADWGEAINRAWWRVYGGWRG